MIPFKNEIRPLLPFTEYKFGDRIDSGGGGLHIHRVLRDGVTDDLQHWRKCQHLIETPNRVLHFHECWTSGTATFVVSAHKSDYNEEEVIMGMANSDDEAQIAEDIALLDWAREAPESPGDYDHAPTEEDSIAHNHAVRKWKERKPRTRSKYDR